MEFTYRISEADYLSAWKIARKSPRLVVLKMILFWAFVLICLVLLFGVIQRSANQPSASNNVQMETTPNPPPSTKSLPSMLVNMYPLGIVVVAWIGLIFFLLPLQIRRMYRRDTNLHGDNTVTLDSRSFSIRSSVGTAFQSGWNAFKEWHENRGMFLIRHPSGTFQIINAKGLSNEEQNELREILAVALPKK